MSVSSSSRTSTGLETSERLEGQDAVNLAHVLDRVCSSFHSMIGRMQNRPGSPVVLVLNAEEAEVFRAVRAVGEKDRENRSWESNR